MSTWEDDGSAEQARLVKESRKVTQLTQVSASAVPSVPKEISATQRLAALNLARLIEEYGQRPELLDKYGLKLLRDSRTLLLELAR